MRKKVQGFEFNTNNLILVKKYKDIEILRTTKCKYIKLKNNKYTLLDGLDLKKAAIDYNFKIEIFQKSSIFVHAILTESENKKLEKYKKKYNINTNNAIKKLIDNI